MFDDDVQAHDSAVRRAAGEIWIGAEPTFTNRFSQEPHWLFQAEGGDKEELAQALLLALCRDLPQKVRTFRALGRQFPGETSPRFCYAALWSRADQSQGRPGDPCTLQGAPILLPTPDPQSALLTVTPDPGVVEVNLAPATSLQDFHRQARSVHRAAAEVGLSAERYRYNGELADSGGGGQITLGGPTPGHSPFFRHPHLLLGLLRYFNRHPCLSYAFSTESLGSASQGPRPDEGARERFDELEVCLDRLSACAAPTPELLGQALGPLLVDGAGNSHRCEVNVEKLWNPAWPDRGMLGLVELRALKMQPSAEKMVAIAALFRSIAARIAQAGYDQPLIRWEGQLHDRFALPFFLAQDLQEVFADLDGHGLAPGTSFGRLLLEEPEPLAQAPLSGATLEVRAALEFWPLVGDVASQERSGARVVDSSTRRLEVRIIAPEGESPGELSANGWLVELRRVGGDSRREVHLCGLRLRTFQPRPGFHPDLGPQGPLRLRWKRKSEAVAIDLHDWIPGGGAYPGLPVDGQEAARRRKERVRKEPMSSWVSPKRPEAPAAGLSLDLRRLPTLDFPPCLS